MVASTLGGSKKGGEIQKWQSSMFVSLFTYTELFLWWVWGKKYVCSVVVSQSHPLQLTKDAPLPSVAIKMVYSCAMIPKPFWSQSRCGHLFSFSSFISLSPYGYIFSAIVPPTSDPSCQILICPPPQILFTTFFHTQNLQLPLEKLGSSDSPPHNN